MKQLEILIGPIASGKSTYCKQEAQKGALIINDDEIVTMLHGSDYSLYKDELKPIYKAVENTIIQSALTLNQRVIIDRPNYSRAMRRRYIGLAKSLDSEVIAVLFADWGVEIHSHRRFKSDSRGYQLEDWKEVYNRHKQYFELPEIYEGFDEVKLIDWPIE